MSNESNTSLFTILLSHTKDLFTSVLSYFFLKGNEFTFKIAAGLLISTAGGVMFSSKSICDNMITGKSMKSNKISSKEELPSNRSIEIKNLAPTELAEEGNGSGSGD